MILHKDKVDDIEVLFSPKDVVYKKLIVCIPGGGKIIGASRFNELQKVLFDKNIGSVSINFQGIEGSLGDIETDSLQNRINVTVKVIDWIKDNFTFETISLYGVSMGGYIALGVQKEVNCNGKIILHTPAAYAKDSIHINFNEQFTNILRTPNSWKDSEAFDWLKDIDNSTLLITHSEDEIIPREISETYESIISSKEYSKAVEIEGAEHSIWNNEETGEEFRKQIILQITDFI